VGSEPRTKEPPEPAAGPLEEAAASPLVEGLLFAAALIGLKDLSELTGQARVEDHGVHLKVR